MGLILLRKIRCYAYHGCLPAEAKIGGEYEVDVKIKTDFYLAEKNDDLRQTIDYCDVFEIVKREMSIRSKLIEHAAARIGEALKRELPKIEVVKVRVTKIAPPMNGDVQSVTVEVVR
ncbi:MAG: dihydroneopterin aldolase [Bacteroidia bacterium]